MSKEVDQLTERIKELPRDEKLILVMRVHEKMSFNEISLVMGLNPNIVRIIYRRTLKKVLKFIFQV